MQSLKHDLAFIRYIYIYVISDAHQPTTPLESSQDVLKLSLLMGSRLAGLSFVHSIKVKAAAAPFLFGGFGVQLQ